MGPVCLFPFPSRSCRSHFHPIPVVVTPDSPTLFRSGNFHFHSRHGPVSAELTHVLLFRRNVTPHFCRAVVLFSDGSRLSLLGRGLVLPLEEQIIHKITSKWVRYAILPVLRILLLLYPCKMMPSLLWCCWLGGRKGIRPVKNWVVGCWHGYLLERGADLHMAQLMPLPLSLASVKSGLVLPFWYRLTRVVPKKGLLNGCVFPMQNCNL